MPKLISLNQVEFCQIVSKLPWRNPPHNKLVRPRKMIQIYNLNSQELPKTENDTDHGNKPFLSVIQHYKNYNMSKTKNTIQVRQHRNAY